MASERDRRSGDGGEEDAGLWLVSQRSIGRDLCFDIG